MADLKMVLEKTNDLKWKIDSILKYSCAEEAGDSKEGGRGTSGICRQRGGAPGGAVQTGTVYSISYRSRVRRCGR